MISYGVKLLSSWKWTKNKYKNIFLHLFHKWKVKIKMADFEFSPIFSNGNLEAKEKVQVHPFVKKIFWNISNIWKHSRWRYLCFLRFPSYIRSLSTDFDMSPYFGKLFQWAIDICMLRFNHFSRWRGNPIGLFFFCFCYTPVSFRMISPSAISLPFWIISIILLAVL
jgi:hypothetical protein